MAEANASKFGSNLPLRSAIIKTGMYGIGTKTIRLMSNVTIKTPV